MCIMQGSGLQTSTGVSAFAHQLQVQIHHFGRGVAAHFQQRACRVLFLMQCHTLGFLIGVSTLFGGGSVRSD